jgi:RNA polymerase sigma-70 factor (ECF subfamily)
VEAILSRSVRAEVKRRHTDEELAASAQRGDLRAYGKLVERYQRLVFRIVWSRSGAGQQDVEDLAQETFVKAWQRLETYDPSRPFKAWIARIAVNTAIERHRSDSRLPPMTDLEDVGAVVASSGPDPVAALIGGESRRMLLTRLKELPERYREVVVLRFVEELSYEEITEMLGLPLGSVKTRIFRGRELLRQRLDPALSEGGE